ncbi:unnamed protein product [Nesidiocoris tenuis]|uniref:Uncharacterized protein n=1 Tax=Nesidiocoris tenuis TaxID=355587 RepID=A0A6H5H1Y4_9HEMI|nr:unnamed protein product [Nesidiocoris tenuis]
MYPSVKLSESPWTTSWICRMVPRGCLDIITSYSSVLHYRKSSKRNCSVEVLVALRNVNKCENYAYGVSSLPDGTEMRQMKDTSSRMERRFSAFLRFCRIGKCHILSLLYEQVSRERLRIDFVEEFLPRKGTARFEIDPILRSPNRGCAEWGIEAQEWRHIGRHEEENFRRSLTN